MGFLAGFQIAMFAFVGVELLGTMAAETKDPEKNLPKAVNADSYADHPVLCIVSAGDYVCNTVGYKFLLIKVLLLLFSCMRVFHVSAIIMNLVVLSS